MVASVLESSLRKELTPSSKGGDGGTANWLQPGPAVQLLPDPWKVISRQSFRSSAAVPEGLFKKWTGSVRNGASLSGGFGRKVEGLKVESPSNPPATLVRERLSKGTYDLGHSDIRSSFPPSRLPSKTRLRKRHSGLSVIFNTRPFRCPNRGGRAQAIFAKKQQIAAECQYSRPNHSQAPFTNP